MKGHFSPLICFCLTNHLLYFYKDNSYFNLFRASLKVEASTFFMAVKNEGSPWSSCSKGQKKKEKKEGKKKRGGGVEKTIKYNFSTNQLDRAEDQKGLSWNINVNRARGCVWPHESCVGLRSCHTLAWNVGKKGSLKKWDSKPINALMGMIKDSMVVAISDVRPKKIGLAK